MPPRCEEKGLIAGAVLVAIAAESPAAGASTIDDGELRVAGCTASRMRVELGETVSLNASASDAGFIEFDGDGDGNYKCGDERDFISNATFQEAGTYGPVTRTDGKDTDSWGTPNKPPSLLLTATPNPAATGEQVSFDASGSTDVGLESSVVEFTASSADRAAGERTVAAAFRAFMWSNGVAITDPDRTVNHCALHNSVGCSRVPGNNPIETPATEGIDDGRRVCGGEEFEMVIDTTSKLEETEMISHRGLIVVCRSWKKG